MGWNPLDEFEPLIPPRERTLHDDPEIQRLQDIADDEQHADRVRRAAHDLCPRCAAKWQGTHRFAPIPPNHYRCSGEPRDCTLRAERLAAREARR